MDTEKLKRQIADLQAENARLKEDLAGSDKRVGTQRVIIDGQKRQIAALEAQLKPVSKESGLTDQEIIEGVIPYTLRSVNGLQRALVELGWRKALASTEKALDEFPIPDHRTNPEKGGTK